MEQWTSVGKMSKKEINNNHFTTIIMPLSFFLFFLFWCTTPLTMKYTLMYPLYYSSAYTLRMPTNLPIALFRFGQLKNSCKRKEKKNWAKKIKCFCSIRCRFRSHLNAPGICFNGIIHYFYSFYRSWCQKSICLSIEEKKNIEYSATKRTQDHVQTEKH